MTDAPALPRRFYETASVVENGDAFGVALDSRTLRTPGGAVFVSPTRALAQLCADEWAAQGEHIVPATMPVSQLAFASLDWTPKSRDQLADYVTAFGETDLCCHRADAPSALRDKQAEHWNPIVTWAGEALGIKLPVVTGIIAARVDTEMLASLRAQTLAIDDFQMTALSQATGLAGSVLIGFALLRGKLNADEAFLAAALDNLWALEKWGEDEEARARLVDQQAEFRAIARYLEALR